MAAISALRFRFFASASLRQKELHSGRAAKSNRKIDFVRTSDFDQINSKDH